ncbi:Biofilm associated protein A, partial [Enterobacter bugandensis]
MNATSINVAVIDKKEIIKAEVLAHKEGGKPVKIKAIPNGKYLLSEGKDGVAPENITVKRNGKDLLVALEGSSPDQPELIIEGFFEHRGQLVGKGEDGNFHEFISADADQDHDAAFLIDGESSALVLGAESISGLDALTVSSGIISPALLALGAFGALLAAVGLANLNKHHNKGSRGEPDNNDDNGGDIIVPSPSLNDAIDDQGPITGTIGNGDVTDDTRPTLIGEGTPGNIIIIHDNDKPIGSTIVGDDGKWQFTPDLPLPEGEHILTPVEKDQEGNESKPGEEYVIIIDTTAPEPATLTAVIDDVGIYQGLLQSGDVTDDNKPTLKGTAEAHSLVEIWLDGKLIGTAVTGHDEKWEFTPENAINDGKHEITLVVTDKAGNRSEPTPPFELVIDTTAPGKPGEGSNGGIDTVIDDVGSIQGPVENGGTTDDTTPTLGGGGQQPGDTVTIIDNGETIGTVVVGDDGSWSYTPETPLNDGEHELQIVVTDPAGNESEPSDPYLVIVDTQSPDKPAITDVIDDQGDVTGSIAAGDITDDAQPEIRGTAEAGSRVIIYDNGSMIGSTVADADGRWSFTPSTPLSNGGHSLTVESVDAAGNVSEPSDAFGFELIAGGVPAAPAITGITDDVGSITGNVQPNGVTDDARPTITGTAQAGSTVSVYADGKLLGTTVADERGLWNFTP